MMRFLPLLLIVFACHSVFMSVSFSQIDEPIPVEPDVGIGDTPDDFEILPFPNDEFEEEIDRIKELSLQEYAVEIADCVIENLEQKQEFVDLIQMLDGRFGRRILEYYLEDEEEIVIPSQEEVVEFVFAMVEGLGGLASEDALVGIVIDDISSQLIEALQNLPFTDLQMDVLHIPSPEDLQKERFDIELIYYLEDVAKEEFGAYFFHPFMHGFAERMDRFGYDDEYEDEYEEDDDEFEDFDDEFEDDLEMDERYF